MARSALLVFLLIASGAVAAEDSEVRKTWDGATVEVLVDGVAVRGAMAGKRVQDGLAKLPPGVRLPTIIYAHGCTGLTSRASSLFSKLAQRGFVVIAPDSFARPGRVSLCGARSAQRAMIRLRVEEMRYAAHQVQNAPWADPDNLFLLGQSEGGWTVTSYGGDEFKARIASGTGCRRIRGSTPLLVVNFGNDPWLTRGDSCGGVADDYLKIPGKEHWPWTRFEAKKKLTRFLAEHSDIRFEPEVVARSDNDITIRRKAFLQDVPDVAEAHCATFGKKRSFKSEADGVLTYSCK
jgi:hypothetical protein